MPGECTASARVGTLLLRSASTPSAPVLASWMRPGMNASFEKPAATKLCHLTSMPRFSSSFSCCRMLLIISSPDQTTIHPALIGHQPLLSSHCFDLAEIWSYGCGQPQSVNLWPLCACAPLEVARSPSSKPPAVAATLPRNLRRSRPVADSALSRGLPSSRLDESMASSIVMGFKLSSVGVAAAIHGVAARCHARIRQTVARLD